MFPKNVIWCLFRGTINSARSPQDRSKYLGWTAANQLEQAMFLGAVLLQPRKERSRSVVPKARLRSRFRSTTGSQLQARLNDRGA